MYNIGQGTVNLLDHNEEYVVTFPSGFGRSILTVPWVELGEMSKKLVIETIFGYIFFAGALGAESTSTFWRLHMRWLFLNP